MAKPSDKPSRKSGARKGPADDPRESDEILPVRQLSILIVDDDPVDRMTVLRALKGTKLNPKITEATDIASAVDLIRKNGFDVVLLDHILPDGKSIDLLRKLRDAGIRLPVIVTTGYGDEMLVADLLKTGAADYLPKDRISADAVARAISHAIRIHKAEEEKLKKDILLEAGAEAVILLNTQTDRISVVNGALGILGKALGADRLTAFEQTTHATAKLPAISHRFEWSRDSEDLKYNDPALQNMTYQSLGLARWNAVISSGHSIGGAVHSLPSEEQPFFTGRGVKCILATPVIVDGRCWGFVLIEDHRAERAWAESEKNMLTSVATAIGSTLMHRRADEALRQSEERFRAIVEAQTEYICRFLPNGIVTFVNEACCRYSGKKREELIGRPFTPYIAEEDRRKLLDQLASLSPQNPVSVSENRSIGADGKVVWGQWTNRGIFNQQGQLVEIQGVGHDITERKKAESALITAMARLRELEAVINQGPAIAFLWRNAEGWPIEFVSDNIREFGFTAEEVISGKVRVGDLIHADDLPRLEKEVAEHLRCGHNTYAQEYRMLTRNREARWVEDRTTVIRNAEGQITHFQGVVWDVTHRKRVEQELRESREYLNTIINSIGDPVFVKDSQHRFVMVNEAECALADRNREEMIGKTDYDFFPKEEVDTFWKFDEQVLATGQENMNEENVTDPYGRMHTIITKKTRYTDPAGKRYIVGVIRDITDRKRAEDEVRRSEEQLRAQYKGFPIPTFTWTLVGDDFVLTDFNDAGMALTENNIKKYEGCRAAQFHKDRPDIVADIRQCMNDKSTFSRETDLHFVTTGKVRRLNITYVFVPPNQVMVHTDDVTERRRAEAALRESEEQYRSLVNNIAVGVFRSTLDGKILQLNPAILGIFGYDTFDQVMNLSVPEFYADLTDRAAVIEEIRSKGTLRDRVVMMKRRDGTVFPASVSSQIHVGKNGEILWLDGVLEDITDRVKAEQAIRESEAKYRTLAEASPDMIFMCAPNSDIIYTNSFGAKQWNLRPEQVAGKKQEELFPPEIAERHKQAIRRVCETREPYFSEVTEMLQQSKVWIETRLVPITNAAGDVTSILGVSRNISERRKMEEALRESEANFRALAENARDGIIILAGEDARFIYANSYAVEMGGFTAEGLLQRTLWDIIDPATASEFKPKFQKRIAGDPNVPNRYETSFMHRDGRRIPVDVSIARTIWQGRPSAMAIVRDISLQKQLEAERARLAASLLDIQEKERQEISAMLHDHLGQLLTLTRLELGSVGSYDANSKKSISSAIERLDEALGSVRRLAVSLRPPILDDLGIEVALETLTEEFADGSNIQASFTHTGPKPLLAKTEETCLYRVLQEALTNAAKHSGATRIDVQLRTDGGDICLEIRDNGKGFDIEAQKSQKGIGFIGMRERLSRCGGTLDIRSEADKGTTVLARIPKAGAPGPEEASP